MKKNPTPKPPSSTIKAKQRFMLLGLTRLVGQTSPRYENLNRLLYQIRGTNHAKPRKHRKAGFFKQLLPPRIQRHAGSSRKMREIHAPNLFRISRLLYLLSSYIPNYSRTGMLLDIQLVFSIPYECRSRGTVFVLISRLCP
jgi:hypothetical protein